MSLIFYIYRHKIFLLNFNSLGGRNKIIIFSQAKYFQVGMENLADISVPQVSHLEKMDP